MANSVKNIPTFVYFSLSCRYCNSDFDFIKSLSEFFKGNINFIPLLF